MAAVREVGRRLGDEQMTATAEADARRNVHRDGLAVSSAPVRLVRRLDGRRHVELVVTARGRRRLVDRLRALAGRLCGQHHRLAREIRRDRAGEGRTPAVDDGGRRRAQRDSRRGTVHGDRARMRLRKRIVVLHRARTVERMRVRLIGVEHRRGEAAVVGDHLVIGRVRVVPCHGVTGVHGRGLRREAVFRDLDCLCARPGRDRDQDGREHRDRDHHQAFHASTSLHGLASSSPGLRVQCAKPPLFTVSKRGPHRCLTRRSVSDTVMRQSETAADA